MIKPSVITLGNFDGVHLGHRKLISYLVEIAKNENLQSVAISYTDHPAFTLITKPKLQVLCSAARKKRELLSLGVEQVELLRFTSELANTSAERFLRDYLIPVWHPKVIVMGYDSHFGHLRRGDFDFLCSYAAELGFRVEYVEPLLHEAKVISSSYIRHLLGEGRIKAANELLGKPYCLEGEIGHGIGKGTGFGFPTANLNLSNPHQLIPQTGIYLSRAHFNSGTFFGLTNIGSSPTVKQTGIIEIETYILDFNASLYGQTMEVELLEYLREEKMFASVNQLIDAMHKDLKRAEALIEEYQR